MVYDAEIQRVQDLISEVELMRQAYGDKITLVSRSDGKVFLKSKVAGQWSLTYVKKDDRTRIIQIVAKIRTLEALKHELECLRILRSNICWVQELTGLVP